MRTLSTIVRTSIFAGLTFSMLAASGCSNDDKQGDNVQPQNQNGSATPSAQDTELAAEYQRLPQAVVIRVPVDASGKEVAGNAEMRTFNGQATVSESNTAALFAESEAARVVASADELDADSSTQSWQNPVNNGDNFDGNYTAINIEDVRNSNINVTVNNGSHGGVVGGGHHGGCGGSSWCGYYPRSYSLVHTASYWAFPRPRCYGFGGYNYYWYPRPSCTPWRWCGR